MLKICIGFDHRQPISFSTLCYSILKHASQPVSITPLILSTLPIKRQGLTPFTFSRFLVPWLCDYKGWALFLDADMLLTSDITKILDYADSSKDVMVCKNPLRFEWSSVMLFNCEKCTKLTPEFVETEEKLHGLQWAESIGEIPGSWNHLVGYDNPNPSPDLIHYTQGVPCFPETRDSEHAELWRGYARESASAITWKELMGNSVHAEPVYKRLNSTT